jgi:hypothetical protein
VKQRLPRHDADATGTPPSPWRAAAAAIVFDIAVGSPQVRGVSPLMMKGDLHRARPPRCCRRDR